MRLLDLIEPHPTWEVIDSSKLTTYMACPRKYFFQYVLGWRSDYPVNHLVFGTAWHLAVEHLLRNGYTKESIEEAQFLFEHRYREDFDTDTDADMAPKTPLNAMVSLQDYAHRFISDVRQYQVLHTEIAGMVLIAPNSVMHFKLDSLVKDRGTKKYLYIDHKTSQRKYSNWGDHWTLSTQMLLYYHAINCLYPREEVGDCQIRCTFFYTPEDLVKKKSTFRPTEFEEFPINKSLPQMEAWLARTNTWYNNLKYDMKLVEEEDTENITMQAFPQNESACFDYGQQCSFFDYCNAYSNPLKVVARGVPLGFRKEYWDPRDQENIRENVGIIGGDLLA